MSAAEIDLTNLKRAIVMRLDCEAKEHSKGHQKSYANRYSMRSSDGALIELMFEKGEKSPANLWVKEDFVRDLLDGSIPWRCCANEVTTGVPPSPDTLIPWLR